MKEIKSVLIVEDDPDFRELARMLFKRGGYTVLEAEDAETGLKIAEDARPDVIVLDWQLPKLDGLHALQILRNGPKTKNIPCIIVTASATEDQVKLLKASSACGYITKPVDTRTFVEKIMKLAGGA